MNRCLSFLTPLLTVVLLCSPAMAVDDESTLISKAETAATTGDWDKAATLYQQAAEQNPDSALALSRLAGALLASQKYADSIPVFQRAISKDQQSAESFIGLGVAYLHMGRYNASRAAFTEARKLKDDKQDVDKLIAWIDKKLASGERVITMQHPSLGKAEGERP